MDDLSYGYTVDNNGRLVNNKLRHVKDAVDNGYAADIKNQPDGNYSYDKIGNLTADNTEQIQNINWTVYGKIAGIQKSNTTISYEYDAGGNRINKKVTDNSGSTTTHYVRDAQGNVLGVYGYKANAAGTLTEGAWKEQDLYGSSRIGMVTPNFVINSPLSSVNYNAANNFTDEEGKRLYELTNHLGNVMVTISDKVIGVPVYECPPCPPDEPYNPCDAIIDHYEADVVSASDYYPLGMHMPGRTYNAGSSYRYGFNGKENDNEIKGEGNQQDYGMRIYDPRLGRFLSTDPLTQKYPWYTPYQFSGNSPIKNVDIDGLEPGGNPSDWEVVPGSVTSYTSAHKTESGKTVIATATQQQVKDKAGFNGYITHFTWPETTDGLTVKANDYSWYNEDPKMKIPAKDVGRWQRFETDIIKNQKGIWKMADNIGIATFGAAAIGTALPAAANLAPIASNYFSTAIQAQVSERLASSSADGLTQYVGNIPKFGFGANNFKNLNVSSMGLNFLAPGSNVISAVGGSGLEFNFANGYQGLGSGGKSLNTFMLQSAIGAGGNIMGNSLGGVISKYSNAGSFLNHFTGNVLGYQTANTVQTISNEMNKKDGKQ